MGDFYFLNWERYFKLKQLFAKSDNHLGHALRHLIFQVLADYLDILQLVCHSLEFVARVEIESECWLDG